MISPTARQESIELRIWPLECGCLEWTGARNLSGHGVLTVERRRIYIHRWLWQRKHGPLPIGTELHHTCRNPWCVNLDHLKPVTRREHAAAHVDDRKAKYLGRKLCKHGHPWAKNVARNTQGRLICRKCRSLADQRYHRKRKRNR